MDPISLAFGITSLVALSAQTLKLTKQYIHGVKHASEAAKSLATELQLLHDTRRSSFRRNQVVIYIIIQE